MQFLRTPDNAFDALADYPFAPHYVNFGDGRMHYVDENAGAQETILCLHGEPSWSYLYRKMIPALSQDYRVIAPDLFGFGKSDKPAEIADHDFAFHFASLEHLLTTLDLQAITLVCQDWGGILGLPLAMAHPERFRRLVIMNTGLPTGERKPTDGFLQWVAFARQMGVGIIPGKLIETTCVEKPDEATIAAYDAPFPDASYRAGVAAMPLLVPLDTHHPTSAPLILARERLQAWQKPVLIMFSDKDPVTAGGEKSFQKMIPTANDYPFIRIEGAGHFLQEEQGALLAQHILTFMAKTATNTN